MLVPVTDSRSSPKDQIAHAAEILSRSEQRRMVFKEICRGKSRVKTITQISAKTQLDRKQVLDAGKNLADNHIVSQTKADGETAYEKDAFYSRHKRRILALARSPKKLAAFPTKVNPRGRITHESIRIPRTFVSIKPVTVDDIDSFRAVHTAKHPSPHVRAAELSEKVIKQGFQQVIGEQGQFTDWGGEKSDLFTTRLRLGGRRVAAAVAFKGRGTRGRLVPAKMGRNGDQLQRLFQSSGQAFLVQYVGQIDESVLEQMEQLAKAKSVSTGLRIYFGIIDGDDTERLIAAYPKAFGED